MDLDRKHIHFMGAGGIGVSALAELALSRGAAVTACDAQENGITRRLQSLGIPVAIGHDPEHLRGTDLLVYSSAIPPANPERAAAEPRLDCMRRGRFLGVVLRPFRVAGVCGTHGKSTTTWILAQLCIACGLDPTVLLGAIGAGETSNLRIGASDLAVAELDESDGSFLETTVSVAVVPTVDADHLDYYGSSEAVAAAFAQFAGAVCVTGDLVYGYDDPGARRLGESVSGRSIGCGLGENADLRAVISNNSGGYTHLNLTWKGRALGEAVLHLPGIHNVQNALCALGAAHALGCEWDSLLSKLGECRGVERRFFIIDDKDNINDDGRRVIAVDDYAHHPVEIEATLRTARSVHGGRIVAIFQPHLYSRTREFAGEFGAALSRADRTVLAEIYPAREAPIPGVTAGLIVDAVRAAGGAADGPFSLDDLEGELRAMVRDGDMLLFLGAGNIGEFAHGFMDRL